MNSFDYVVRACSSKKRPRGFQYLRDLFDRIIDCMRGMTGETLIPHGLMFTAVIALEKWWTRIETQSSIYATSSDGLYCLRIGDI